MKELVGVSGENGEHEQHVQFFAPGIRGEAVLLPHPDGARTLELGHVMVESKYIAARIDPRLYGELEKQFGTDEATIDFVRKEAERWVERFLAYEALVVDGEAKGDMALIAEAKAALERTRNEITLRFKGLSVLRTEAAVLAPEAVTAWTPAQQEAARKVVEYHKSFATGLQAALDAYVNAHGDDPRLVELRAKVAAEQEKALQTDSYSVADIERRIAENDPGTIPTVELAPGAQTVEESARTEAGQLFESWVNV